MKDFLRNYQHRWRQTLAALLISALLGFLAYAAIVEHIGYKIASARLQTAVLALSSSTFIRYGEVVSVDTGAGDVTVRTPDLYTTSSEKQDLQFITSADTILIRQELSQSPDGTITGISRSSYGSLSDLVPGTPVRVYGLGVVGGKIQVQAIVYGNPL